ARARSSLDTVKRGILRRDADRLLREPAQRVDSARARLQQTLGLALANATSRLNELRTRHRTHHPLRVLERRAELLASLRLRHERAGQDLTRQRTEQLQRLRG